MNILNLGGLSGTTIFVILGVALKMAEVNASLGPFNLADLLIVLGLAGWGIFFLMSVIRNIL